MARKALGRGLSALLGDAAAVIEAPREAQPPLSASGLEHMPLELIEPNPFQPRRVFPEQQLSELAESIRSAGVVQPVLVRRSGDRYQLVAGERRLRAAAIAGLKTIPAVVREIDDNHVLEIAITENLLREDLSAVETAHAFQALQERFGYSHEQIAARLGMDRATVTNTIRLLKLPESVQRLVEDKKLSAGHARALLACATPEMQNELAERAVKDGLSVRDVERRASAPRRAPKPEAAPPQDANLRAAIVEMERTLGTKVTIVGSETSGKIEISYYSASDLNRLFEWITRK